MTEPVTLEEAYAEACQALGESIVRERLLAKRLTKATEVPPEPEVPPVVP